MAKQCKHRVPRLSERKRSTLLPLLSVLEQLSPESRIIILSHLDDCAREALIDVISTVIRSSLVDDVEQEFMQEELIPFKENIRYLVDTKFKNKNKKKDHLIKIGGSPMSAILSTGIPILLRLFR